MQELYRQQKQLYDEVSRRVDDRIVSISQPHVVPIKRGEAMNNTKFGAKLSCSLVDGVTYLDHLSRGNFNLNLDLAPPQVESCKEQFECYPESIYKEKQIQETLAKLRNSFNSTINYSFSLF